jgi:hypothetical protein
MADLREATPLELATKLRMSSEAMIQFVRAYPDLTGRQAQLLYGQTLDMHLMLDQIGLLILGIEVEERETRRPNHRRPF